MRYKIAVSGASKLKSCVKGIEELAERLGQEIAKNDLVLVTGATSGAPFYAAKGCKEKKGISIGFSPAASLKAHKKVYRLPTDYFDLIVYTGFDYSGRNLLMTRAADGVIICCGRMGTLNEFTIAYEDRKPIGVLEGSGGTADLIRTLARRPHTKRGEIIYDSNPEKLVQKLLKIIEKKKK
jgi:uncharacterized protein (TIGR00725 family)